MRFSTSTVSAVAVSLLAKDVLAGHAHRHKSVSAPLALEVFTQSAPVSIVTDEYVETITSTIYVTVEWPPASTSAQPTTTSSVTTTTSETSTVVAPTSSVTPVAAPPAPVVSSAAVAPIIVIPTTLVAVTRPKPTTAAPAPAPTTPAPAPEPATTTTPAPAPATTTPAAAAIGKKGVPYNTASLVSAFGDNIAWAYNWDSSPDGLSGPLNYVPMLWSDTDGFTKQWKSNADAAIAAGSTHLLSFNEPDLAAQSNLAFGDAASSYITYMQPYAGKAKLVSPAVTNGGGSMGLTYLENFMSSCKDLGCTVDTVAIHWYGDANNLGDLKTHVTQAHASANKDGGNRPIWLTEFGASGSDADVATFLSSAVEWLESQSFVERYAYFMASDGVMLSGTSLSSIGEAFIS